MLARLFIKFFIKQAAAIVQVHKQLRSNDVATISQGNSLSPKLEIPGESTSLQVFTVLCYKHVQVRSTVVLT